jgi:hypothetical protein
MKHISTVPAFAVIAHIAHVAFFATAVGANGYPFRRFIAATVTLFDFVSHADSPQ